jgi:hypothetical protein
MLGVWLADADVDAARDELLTRSLDVGDDQELALSRAGAADVRFTPNWTELPEPGGVNWIRRKCYWRRGRRRAVIIGDFLMRTQ